MVRTDGRVTTCCLDEGMENVLGNLREAHLADLWAGETITAWRLAQVEGRFEDSGPYCTRCDWWNAGAMPPEKVAGWLARLESTRAAAAGLPPAPLAPRPGKK